jgi:hypothetical protein
MDQQPESMTLSNICGGGVEEVFQKEWAKVLENIADINVDPESKRKLTLEFTISPFEDRSGAQVTFSCKSKTIPVDAVKGTVFLQRRGLVMVAIPHDPKQIRMFDGKMSAANDGPDVQ